MSRLESQKIKTDSDVSQQTSLYTEGVNTSDYRSAGPNTSFQSQFTTDVGSDSPTTDQGHHASDKRSCQSNQNPKERIKLIPLRVKDLKEILKNVPEYSGKKPVMINIKENDIDEVIEKQRYVNSLHSASLQQGQKKPIPLQVNPISVSRLEEYVTNKHSYEQENSSRHTRTSFDEQTSTSAQYTFAGPKQSKTPLNSMQPQQVYAMTDIQAFPMIGGDRKFRANQKMKKRKLPKKRSKSRRIRSKSRHNRPRTRSPSRFKSRGRSRQPFRSKPRRVVRSRSKKSPRRRVIIKSRRRSPAPYRDTSPCTFYPMCSYECSPVYNSPTRIKRPRERIAGSKLQLECECHMCQEKLQFIQPGVCTQKRDQWTNEYAIIPKPQVNLIDPCKDLDPAIYPRAERPCIRDGRGNPLTDCIGRPLRNPLGAKFLNFSANGSILDTSVTGNFFTGQPPLCVKCTLPNSSCAPDTTHSWWMSCGYPVKPNMGPFYNRVIAEDSKKRRF